MRGESYVHRHRLDRKAVAVLEEIGHRHHVGLAVVQADRHVLRAEDLGDLVTDEIDDRLEVELRGEPLLDAVDDGQLGGALLAFLEQALRLVEEPRILERGAKRRGDRHQQTDIGFSERVFALVVLHRDVAENLVAADDRHRDQGLAAVGARDCPARQLLVVCCSVENDGPARARHRFAEAARGRRAGWNTQPLAMLVRVQVVGEVGLFVVPADPHVTCVEHFAQLVADEVDDRLEIELRRHALLDAVDDGELGGALLGLLQQALRLVEQARVLERDAHAATRPS